MFNRIRAKLRCFLNDEICEQVNRRANRDVVRASVLWHSGNKLKMLWAMCLHARNIKRYGCEIYPQATIGKGLYIPHCIGIVVGSTTIIGENCTIFPNVVFGAKYSPNKNNPKGRRHAKVGDNCVFGANASIIGKVTIGDNVIIGAGAVVTKDIPNNVTVVGINRIIS